MASFNELFDSFVSKVKDSSDFNSVRNFYDKGTEKAKTYTKIAKLNLEINADSEELKKVFLEIGRLYYEQNASSPDGFFAPLFTQAEALNAAIASKQAELASLKESASARASAAGEAADADFEEIVDAVEAEITDKPVEEASAEAEVEAVEDASDFERIVSDFEPKE